MYLTTHSQRLMPLDPEEMHPDHICWDDIATQLAKQCRFNGACAGFYSVAEHSVLVSQSVPEHLQFLALLHDAAEAYLGDLVRPIKVQCPAYNRTENALMHKIYRAAGIEPPSFSDEIEIKMADNAVLNQEFKHFWPNRPLESPIPPAKVRIVGLDWQEARLLFIHQFNLVRPGFIDALGNG